MDILERFIKYVKLPTQSNDNCEQMPTNPNETAFARQLAAEMQDIGIPFVATDDIERGYVYGTLPASPGYEDAPTVGFIAHMDTAPAFSGDNINPRVIRQYNGKDVELGTSGRTLSVSQFPHLLSLKGRTLVVTDGNTLLGADDKAGIAEIMTAVERIIKEDIPHGNIVIAFTPDEEIGRGTDGFDMNIFGANFAYTVDGGAENIVENENFNAEMVFLTVNGFNVHPGDGKDVLVNALTVASRIEFMMGIVSETPRESSGRQGFHYLVSMTGDTDSVQMIYALRDFEVDNLNSRRSRLQHIIDTQNALYGDNTVVVDKDYIQYQNMRDLMPSHIVDTAFNVIKSLGMDAKLEPIRGGTDGAMLTYKGLPCPNLGTGGYAYHGPYEHITVEGMKSVVDVIIGIVSVYAERC